MTERIPVSAGNDLSFMLARYRGLAETLARPADTLPDAYELPPDSVKGPYLVPAQLAWLNLWLATRSPETRTVITRVRRHDYVGPYRPDGVLVGDTPGTAAPSYGAFTPWPNGCGEHLMNALRDAGVATHRIGLVNSLNVCLLALWTSLGAPRMVALGRNAHRRLTETGIPVAGFVYHPQYELRFRHVPWKRRDYGLRIKEYLTPFSRLTETTPTSITTTTTTTTTTMGG